MLMTLFLQIVPWHLIGKTTPLSPLSDKRSWQTQIFLEDWGSKIQQWYPYPSKDVCIGYFWGNWANKLKFCWHTHESYCQTPTELGRAPDCEKCRLVGKLNHLAVTRLDIFFVVNVMSQFLNSPNANHWNAIIRIWNYIKGSLGKSLRYSHNNHTKVVCYWDAAWAWSPFDRRSTSGYCVYNGYNLVSWKSKRQNVVARSSANAEFRAVTFVTYELIWLKQLLKELQFGEVTQMTLICDNQSALHINCNLVFHERTKHIEIDCNFFVKRLFL